MLTRILSAVAFFSLLLQGVAFGEGAPAPVVAQMQPYRTFITVESYIIDNNGDPKNPISNVRLEVKFPGERVAADKPPVDKKFELPEGGQFWTVGNGQRQDIKRTYELPWGVITNDGFNFQIQMVRKGNKMLPCNFTVSQLSQYNRSYFCHTDIQWQMEQKVTDEHVDKEGIQIRVFTDKNTPIKELPKDAVALK